VEKRTGLDARFYCQTGCIQDMIIKYFYTQIPNDFLYSVEDKKNCSCIVGGVLIKAAGAASSLKMEVTYAQSTLKSYCP
jgi:hypothetical protein